VIQKVHAALENKGLYQGEINGQLDEATMKAIAKFAAIQYDGLGR
jgi:hypothetical protein